MNKVRFLAKIAMAASVFAALTFTVSCSDDPDDKEDYTGKWCVINWIQGTQQCGKIGDSLLDNGDEMTKLMCELAYSDSSIKDERPDDCILITE